MEAVATEDTAESVLKESKDPMILYALWNPGPNVEGAQSVGHFLLVDGYDRSTDTFRVFDPPALPSRSQAATVLQAWTGKAVLFGEAGRRVIAGSSWLAFGKRLVLASAGVLLGLASIWLFRKKGRRAQRAAALLLVGGSAIGGAGCYKAPSAGPASTATTATRAPSIIDVVGQSTWDFGRVRDPKENLRHQFTLRNSSGRPITVTDVRKSCGCTSAEIVPRTIPPKGEAQAIVEIDTKLVVGKKITSVLVVFEDPAVEPLTLKADAYVEVSFRVTVAPAIWTLPMATSPGDIIERVFQLTAFGEESDEPFEVAAKTKAADLSIQGPIQWKKSGQRAAGFAREAQMVLKYRVSARNQTKDTSLLVELEHRCKNASPETYLVTVTVRRT